MTHTPQPPSVDVRTVMFGQAWTDPNGMERFADADTVILTLLHDGTPHAALLQTPESAIALGKLLIHHAGTAIRNTIDDDGNRPSLKERLTRINEGFAK